LHLLTCNALKGFEEIVEREAIREVFEKRLHRQPRAPEDRRASENTWIRHNYATSSGLDCGHRAHKCEPKPFVPKRQVSVVEMNDHFDNSGLRR
jgi:hypothetical protein